MLERDARRGIPKPPLCRNFLSDRTKITTIRRSAHLAPLPSTLAQIMTDGLPARSHREAIDGRTCTLAASILLLRRYTERHDFTARVYDESEFRPAPTELGSRSVTFRVAFDDDATATNVLVECKRAFGNPIDVPKDDAPVDVIIATLKPGIDPDPVAAALQTELDSAATDACFDFPRSWFFYHNYQSWLIFRQNSFLKYEYKPSLSRVFDLFQPVHQSHA